MSKMTLETLARMVQKGFLDVTGNMARREDLFALGERVDKLERSTDNRFIELLGEIKELREEIKEVDSRSDVLDLEERVKKLEKKAGLKP